MGHKRDQSYKSSHPLTCAASRPAPASGSARSSLSNFQAWMRKAGIRWDESSIQLRMVNAPGRAGGVLAGEATQSGAEEIVEAPWAVFAVSDVAEGRVLATIPRCTVLSAANCGLADILAAEKLGGGLALVAGVMYEAARGSKSKWCGYLSSLPPREYLPVFWSNEQLSALQSTEAEQKAGADREAMAADFNAELAPLLKRYPARLGPLAHGWTQEAFMRAASWVASRAFYVDEHHGDALVPLADLFNHKAARVDLRGRGGWAKDLVVAEHADGPRGGREPNEQGGGKEESKEKVAASDEEQPSSSSDDMDADEDEDQDEDEEEGEGEEKAMSSSGAANSSEEEEEEDEKEEDQIHDEEQEGEEQEQEQEEGQGSKVQMRQWKRADLDREPGDDGDAPWPPAPPAPPALHPAAAAADGTTAAAAASVSGDAASTGCGNIGGAGAGGDGDDNGGSRAAGSGRWGALAEAAVVRGGLNLHLDIGICAVERGECEVLDIVAAQPLTAGAEVYNTYGEHGNAELVNKYGFALPYNPFDEVSVDKAALRAAAEAQLGRKAAQRRARFLEKYSELLAEDEEPFFLLPPTNVNTQLYVALLVLAADDRQLACWKKLEDAMQPLRDAWLHERSQQQQQQQQQEALQQGLPVPRLQQEVLPLLEANAKKDACSASQADKSTDKGTDKSTDKGTDKCKGHNAKRHRGEIAVLEEADGDCSGGERPFRKTKRRKASAAAAGDPSDERDAEEAASDGGDGDDEEDLPEDVEIQGPSSGGVAGSEPESMHCSTVTERSTRKGKRNGKSKSPKPGVRDNYAGSKTAEEKGPASNAGQGGGSGDGDGGGCTEAPVVQLWTEAMRSLLRAVVSERLAGYPTTLEQDERELESRGLEGQQRAPGPPGGRSGGGRVAAACTHGEAEAAWRCALLLRMGEKRLLKDVLMRLGP